MMSELLDAHLGGSDGAALGGDLAYQYGKAGTLAGIGLPAAQSVLGIGRVRQRGADAAAAGGRSRTAHRS